MQGTSNGHEIKKSFTQDGYVALPGFFSQSELGELLALFDELEREFADKPVPPSFRLERSGCGSLGATLNDHPVAREMSQHPRLREVTEAIVGPDFQMGSIGSWITKKGYGQGWHQDSFTDEPGQFVVNRLIYAREVPSNGGPLYVVPGSHRMGDMPAGGNQDSLPGEMAMPVAAGTLVFLHSRCYHRVAINQSERPRIQLNTRVIPAEAREDMTYRAIYRTGRWDFRENKEW
ncbi:MAG TPA: phytanoyl-CoA dioxygenase family protein [Lacipirellulaceae bacterium]|nr:phytanoyl-CoA dioxygenase family protein [Lacipirellulaceae bacterium]